MQCCGSAGHTWARPAGERGRHGGAEEAACKGSAPLGDLKHRPDLLQAQSVFRRKGRAQEKFKDISCLAVKNYRVRQICG